MYKHMRMCVYLCVFMYMQVYTHVSRYELTIDMYSRMCIYVYVHIGAETYLCGWPYVFCAGSHNPTRVLVETVR